MTIKLCVCHVKGIFRRQCHINPIPSQQLVVNRILVNSQTRGMRALAPVGEWYERILPILDHVRLQTFCEGIQKFL